MIYDSDFTACRSATRPDRDYAIVAMTIFGLDRQTARRAGTRQQKAAIRNGQQHMLFAISTLLVGELRYTLASLATRAQTRSVNMSWVDFRSGVVV